MSSVTNTGLMIRGAEQSQVFQLHEVVGRIFICIKNPRDFQAAVLTCQIWCSVSRSFPVIALTSLPNRFFLLEHAVAHNVNLMALDAKLKSICSGQALLKEEGGESIPLELAVKEAEGEFFGEYIRFCQALNLSPHEFKDCASIACGQGILPIARFGDRIFSFLVEEVTNRPVESITIAVFKEYSDLLKALFPLIRLSQIEACIRQSLLHNGDNAFKALSNEFSDLNPENPRVTKIRKQLTAELETEKTQIEGVLSKLCGTDNSDGWLNEAYSRMVSGEAMSYETYCQICEYFSEESGSYEIFNQTFHGISEYEWLKIRLGRLAEWNDDGILIGGRYLTIQSELEDVHLGAGNEATKIGSFYAELTCSLSKENEMVRHFALRRIIGYTPL